MTTMPARHASMADAAQGSGAPPRHANAVDGA